MPGVIRDDMLITGPLIPPLPTVVKALWGGGEVGEVGDIGFDGGHRLTGDKGCNGDIGLLGVLAPDADNNGSHGDGPRL